MKLLFITPTLLLIFVLTCTLKRPASSQDAEVKLFPDFEQISFSDLEGILESGEIDTEFNEIVGYDASRQYSVGDTPDEILKLGDLETSLMPQQFTLADIANLSNSNEIVDLNTIPLTDFPLIGNQTLENLVEAVPELGAQNAEDVEPVASLLEQSGFGDLNDSTIESIIDNEEIAELELDTTDLNEFSVEDIPNLENTQLGNLENSEESFISEIPGLGNVPIGRFPGGIEPSGSVVARIDLIWGSAESDRNNTISGSFVEGFSVPCQTNCEYLELDDLENFGAGVQSPFEGDQWIAGRENYVAGGTGCFAGGREPTGIHPFGNLFKHVLWNTNEVTDTARTVMFFNIKTNCGESPYFIGPVPFPSGQVRTNDYIFLGVGG